MNKLTIINMYHNQLILLEVLGHQKDPIVESCICCILISKQNSCFHTTLQSNANLHHDLNLKITTFKQILDNKN